MKHYLIDSENVGDFWIPLLEIPADQAELIVFYTKNSPHMSYDSLIKLKESDRKVIFIKCYEGTNALDFQLCSELGYCIARNENDDFIIVTNDTGYDAAVKYWRHKEYSVKRIAGKDTRTGSRKRGNLARYDVAAEVNSILHKLVRASEAEEKDREEDGYSPDAAKAADTAEFADLSDPETVSAYDDDSYEDPGSDSEGDYYEEESGDEPADDGEYSPESDEADGRSLEYDTDEPENDPGEDDTDDEFEAEDEEEDAPEAEDDTDDAEEEDAEDESGESFEAEEPAADEPDPDHREAAAAAQTDSEEDTADTTLSGQDAGSGMKDPEAESDAEEGGPAAEAEENAAAGDVSDPGDGSPAAEGGGIFIPDREEITAIVNCIGLDNLAELHNQLIQFYGEHGKDVYQSIKSGTLTLEKLDWDKEEKFLYYCALILRHSEEPEEALTEENIREFAEFILSAENKRKNLNSLRYALLKHYGKEKGRRYYFMLKPYVKALNQM